MTAKEGYEPIPDVDLEKGENEVAVDVIHAEDDDIVLAKKYPEANALERKFLGKLDHAIANATPKVALPRLKSSDFGPPQSITDLVVTLKYPTLALFFTILSSLLGTFWESPFGVLIFPYYSCIVAYLSSLPATKGEIDKKANAFFSKVEGQKARAEKRLEGVVGKALGFIEGAQDAMETAMSPIKETLSKATELEKMLQKIDPDIDIPDTTDIEEAFDGCTDKVESIVKLCEEAVDISKKIPRPLQNKGNFDKFIVYPLLAFFLATQLIEVWQIQKLGTLTNSPSAIVANNVVRKLGASNSSTFVVNTDLIINAVQSYVTVVVQLLLTFVMAHVSVFAKQSNMIIKKIESSLNKALDERAAPIFHVVFEDGFGGIKKKMLTLIHKIEKIEAPLEKVQEMKKFKGGMGAIDDKLGAIGDKLGGDIIGSAAGKIDTASIKKGVSAKID
jgi:hypothetical protein